MVKQKISERYLDKRKLTRLLCSLFGSGNFEIEVTIPTSPDLVFEIPC